MPEAIDAYRHGPCHMLDQASYPIRLNSLTNCQASMHTHHPIAALHACNWGRRADACQAAA